MKLLNEINRIKGLMSINEATNPILGLALEPFLTKSWRVFKTEFDNSAIKILTHLDNNLDATTQVALRDLSRSKGNALADVMDINEVIDDLMSKASRFTDDELKTLTKELSSLSKFSDNIVKTISKDEGFKDLFKEAIELEGEGYLTPQQIKGVLIDYLGESNATKLYDEMRIGVNPSKILSTTLEDDIILSPTTISGLVNAVEDAKLKGAIEKILEPTTLRGILEKAQDLSKTTKIDKVWFEKQFSDIVKLNPSFWTQLKRGEFNKLVNRLWTDEKTGAFSFKTLGINTVAKPLGLGFFTYLVSSIIAALWTSDDLLDTWKAECLLSKGYTKDNKEQIKKDNPNKWTKDNEDCDKEVRSKETGDALKDFKSYWWPEFSSSDVDIERLKTTTTKYKNTVDDFKKWATTDPDLKNETGAISKAKQVDDPIAGTVIEITLSNGSNRKYQLDTTETKFTY